MMMMMLVPSMRLAGLENESVPARVRGSGLAGGNRRENISLLKYYEYKVQPNTHAVSVANVAQNHDNQCFPGRCCSRQSPHLTSKSKWVGEPDQVAGKHTKHWDNRRSKIPYLASSPIL